MAGFSWEMSGRGGALEMPEGVAPAAKVVYKGVVGAEGSPEVMDAKGTAVGLVERRETGTVVRDGVDVTADPLGETTEEEPVAGDEAGPVADGDGDGDEGGDVVAAKTCD